MAVRVSPCIVFPLIEGDTLLMGAACPSGVVKRTPPLELANTSAIATESIGNSGFDGCRRRIHNEVGGLRQIFRAAARFHS
jgi:hypothetical protein